MAPVVIAIQRDSNGSGLAARLYRAPVDHPGGMDPSLLNLPDPMPECDTDANMIAYGETLFGALSSHQAIGTEIQRLAAMPGAEVDALQFRIETPLAERVRWETLCRPERQFLAVAPGCRITRLVSHISDGCIGVRTYTLPLKVMAFVSAAGIDARPELDELMAQIVAARGKNLPIEAQIYLGDQALLAEKQGKAEPGFKFVPIPDSADAIKAEIKVQEFQFLHLFCHGGTALGVSTLEFATIADKEGDAASGSVKLVVDELVAALEIQRSSWLTVLNSCSGARPVQHLNSMAFKIAERGSPIAVGMNDPIDAGDATHFTRTFYREVLDIVGAALAGAGGEVAEIDVSPAIVAVRQHFYGMYQNKPPEAFGRWSLPVFYENPVSLQVRSLLDPEMKARVDTVAEALRNLPASTPSVVRDQILAILEKPPVVPVPLRPDRFGRFGKVDVGGNG
ncbi:CHAT domain-containing protein [Mesorhizobium sp. M3A.F.Ca.ET.201.01.1.1]|uniref:CHAT domain-containing protein n=1 Tax=Mesorhizobium sp. M3A.F.Ca.ET.201.01.1.1 TaxID=2563946 RepID=UPI0010938591|nr:CHAT domain-containing protein [Mesorhizobium sp. M3A.F.Ca.ET.201.01.1.1]TGS71770.1 CHAT domain-containing protein [Mesorhizobium sp. M3A.F.Ca.ET.201.01.1.1]